MGSQMKAVQDLLLSNVSSAYIPQGAIADLILPVIQSKELSGKLGAYGTNHLRIENTLAGGKSAYRRVEPIVRSTSSYLIEGHGLEGMVSETDYRNSQAPYNAELDETLGLKSLISLDKERSLALTLGSTSILTQNVTLSGPQQFNDWENSDPLDVIATARAGVKAGCGTFFDAIAIIPWEVMNKLKYHPALLKQLGYTEARPGGLTSKEMADILEVREVFVPQVSYESAKEGQTSSLAPVWGKNIIIMIAPKTAQKYQISLGYQVKPVGADATRVFKYGINNPPNSTGILVDDHYDMLVSNAKAAYLIKDAIA